MKKLWPEHQGPIVEALADDLRAQSVGGGLQGEGIGDGEEGIIVLAEVDVAAQQFAFDVVVAGGPSA